jgi:hypothetical protein
MRIVKLAAKKCKEKVITWYLLILIDDRKRFATGKLEQVTNEKEKKKKKKEKQIM